MAKATTKTKSNQKPTNRLGKTVTPQSGVITIHVPDIQTGNIRLTLVGITPLICHAWSQKAKLQMLDKQMGKTGRSKREPKCPEEDFVESLYWLTGTKPSFIIDEKTHQKEFDRDALMKAVKSAKFGLPCRAVKKAMVGAARFVDGIAMTEMKALVFVTGVQSTKAEWNHHDFSVIDSGPPSMAEDMVRIDNGRTADIRYRGRFDKWSTSVNIEYNANFFRLEQVYNLLRLAGFHQGVGEDRPEKSGGSFGRFTINVEG
jgi:hypothetical protein